MTDQDRMLAHSAPHIIPWLEDKKRQKVEELISGYRQKEDTKDEQAEISVLMELISALKSKAEALGRERK